MSMIGTRSALFLVLAPALALTSVFACSPPPQAPTHAEATAALIICFSMDEAEDTTPADAALRKALHAALENAGYKLIPKGRCDMGVSWSYATENRGVDKFFTTVNVAVRRGQEVIERIRVDRPRGDVPVEKPELVAIPVVNAMNASPKLAAYAATRHRGGGGRDGGAGSPDPAAPDAGASAL